MRILDTVLFIKVFIYIVAIIGLLIGNIYILVCLRRNLISIGIHVSSLFGGIYLFCLYMQAVILNLRFEKTYESIGEKALVVGCLFAVLTIVYLIYIKIKNKNSLFLNSDLSGVISGLEDRVMVYDYKGILIECNNKLIQLKIPESAEHQIDILIDFLGKMAIGNQAEWKQGIEKEFLESFEFEVEDGSQNIFQVSVAPIKNNPMQHLGTIIFIHDLTEEKVLLNNLHRQNELLEDTNHKLEQYLRVANNLETEKEKLKLLEGINDILILKIESMIEKIHCLQTQQEDFESYQLNIHGITQELREIFQTIRFSVKNIASTKEDAD